MKIALMSDKSDLNGPVSGIFSEARWLLIVDDESGNILNAIPRGDQNDLQLAEKIVESGCEGLLGGPIEKEAFIVIADVGGVTRYLAAGLSGREALEKFRRRELE